MKKNSLFVFLSLSLFSVFAFGNSDLVSAYGRELMTVQSQLASSGYLGRHQSSCKASTPSAAADGHLSISVVFGYMDVSANPDFYNSASSLVRLGDVLDQPAKKAFQSALTSKCFGRQSKACGFKKSGSVLTKTIKNRFTGRSMKVTIRLVASSVSTSDQANRSTYASKQQSASAGARNFFLSSVQSQDVVLYLGHARSGGGPDFAPPKLLSPSKVDYSYYKSQQEGIRSLLGALQGGRPKVLGVLACNSTPLFAGRLSSAMANGTLLTANKTFDYNDILPTALSTIEAVLGQSCGQEFEIISGWGAGKGMISVR